MSNITTIHKKFSDLSTQELCDILELRQNVFIIEQGCIYPDIDGLDTLGEHIWLQAEEDIISYLRILPSSKKHKLPTIGRMITHPDYRKMGYGKRLMQKGVEISRAIYPSLPIFLSAQVEAKPFYEQLGFIASGEAYLEDGIYHIDMLNHEKT